MSNDTIVIKSVIRSTLCLPGLCLCLARMAPAILFGIFSYLVKHNIGIRPPFWISLQNSHAFFPAAFIHTMKYIFCLSLCTKFLRKSPFFPQPSLECVVYECGAMCHLVLRRQANCVQSMFHAMSLAACCNEMKPWMGANMLVHLTLSAADSMVCRRPEFDWHVVHLSLCQPDWTHTVCRVRVQH